MLDIRARSTPPRAPLNGPVERRLVGPRRLVEARELSHELERGSLDLLVGRGRFEVKQGPNVPAHGILSQISPMKHSFPQIFNRGVDGYILLTTRNPKSSF